MISQYNVLITGLLTNLCMRLTYIALRYNTTIYRARTNQQYHISEIGKLFSILNWHVFTFNAYLVIRRRSFQIKFPHVDLCLKFLFISILYKSISGSSVVSNVHTVISGHHRVSCFDSLRELYIYRQ